MTALEQAVAEIAAFLDHQRIPYMVIGGMANLVWGQPRTTQDVDLTIWVDDDGVNDFLTAIRKTSLAILPREPRSFIEETRVLPVKTSGGVRIDLSFAQMPYEREALNRATAQAWAGRLVKVCTAEDLVLHKIVSDRPKDRDDVRQIISRQKERLDRKYLNPKIQELSHALERPDIWEFYQTCLKS